MKSADVVVFIVCLVSSVRALNNGLARTPPMGWNTWCTDGPCCRDYCDEKEVKEVAEALISSGLRDLGYKYVNLDDCWSAKERDSQGNLQPNSERFPGGFGALIDYLHSNGFKFGVYTCAGTHTCVGGLPGCYGHYVQDAKTIASWGVDFVKMDWCNTKINGTQLDPKDIYPQMEHGLNISGRPVLFSMCEWGVEQPWTWAQDVGNMWRATGDHHDKWSSTSGIIEKMASIGRYAGPGGWNDPDFLMTGGEGCPLLHGLRCPGQTKTEYVTEFSMWAIMAAPLLVATDVRHMDDHTKMVLSNTEVIAVNQDKLGKGGERVGCWNCSEGCSACQIWAKELEDGSQAMAIYNAGSRHHNITATFDLLKWPNATLSLRDLWEHKDLGEFHNEFTASIESHGVVLVKAVKQADVI